jgi:hypothetical protein
LQVPVRPNRDTSSTRAALPASFDPEPGLAAAGHADDHAVGGEVARLEQDHVGALAARRVDLAAQLEGAELLETVVHGGPLRHAA